MTDQAEFAASRRHFLRQGGALAAAAALLGPAQLLAAEQKKAAAIDVTPTEDLMREHGVLRRLMLIFDEFENAFEGVRRISPGLDHPGRQNHADASSRTITRRMKKTPSSPGLTRPAS